MTCCPRCPQVAPLCPSGEIHGSRRGVNQPRDPGGLTAVNRSATVSKYVPGMDETRILALRALRELLDDDGRDDRDDLVACYRALRKAIVKNKPMMRKDRARVAAARPHPQRRGATWFQRQQGAIPAAEPSTIRQPCRRYVEAAPCCPDRGRRGSRRGRGCSWRLTAVNHSAGQ
jgi:hypothetical protein